jgi:hypothetical protein
MDDRPAMARSSRAAAWHVSRPAVRDAITAARATWGVASSPPMPRWREYMAWTTELRDAAEVWNPPDIVLERRLVALATGPRDDALPWADMSAPRSRRVYAGLVSFVDDYEGPYPEELFPAAEVHALRLALRGRPRTIDEQLEAALATTGGRAFAAAILLHAATRLVARNRDSRALGDLAWTERALDAAWIAPFAPEVAGDGDAPGDTYHYWANFAVGMQAEIRGTLVPRAVGAAFYAGPVAMTWIRGRIFRSTLFAGSHAICDRMGLAHGRAVARAGRRWR